MFFRSAFFAATISIICGVLIFFVFMRFTPRESHVLGEDFVILSFCESEDDRLLSEALERGGIENIISESTQRVPIDDFGSIRYIPLDTFHNEVAGFDPRDTGYAAKLSSFFVHEGKRFFFIPLEGTGAAAIKNQIESILRDVPFSLALLRQEKPFLLYFSLLALGCLFSLFFSQARRLFVYQIPVLLAMGWGGFTTAILAALLCGVWELLREPLRELSAARLYGNSYAGAGLAERLKPFRVNGFLVFCFVILILFLFVTSGLSPLPMITACLGFFFLTFVSYKVEKERALKNRHIPFTPVLLFPVKAKTFSIFPFLLPFAVVSLCAVSLPIIFPAFSPTRQNEPVVDSSYFISEDDYNRHIVFQRSFSYRSLNQGFHQGAYLRYYLGEDGLIAGGIDPAASTQEDAPFPLEKLMNFLLDYGNQAVARPASSYMSTVEWISVAFIIAFCFVDMVQPRVLFRKKSPIFWDKRIAA